MSLERLSSGKHLVSKLFSVNPGSAELERISSFAFGEVRVLIIRNAFPHGVLFSVSAMNSCQARFFLHLMEL